MGISDKLKDLRTKATEAAAERSDQIHDAVEKVSTSADQHAGGKYRERIQKVGAKADSFVEGLKDGAGPQAGAGEDPGAAADPPAGGEGEDSTPA